jgi:hypothetical protein
MSRGAALLERRRFSKKTGTSPNLLIAESTTRSELEQFLNLEGRELPRIILQAHLSEGSFGCGEFRRSFLCNTI